MTINDHTVEPKVEKKKPNKMPHQLCSHHISCERIAQKRSQLLARRLCLVMVFINIHRPEWLVVRDLSFLWFLYLICFDFFYLNKVPSLNYPAVAEAALHEGPAWGKSVAPYVGWVEFSFSITNQISNCFFIIYLMKLIKLFIKLFTTAFYLTSIIS